LYEAEIRAKNEYIEKLQETLLIIYQKAIDFRNSQSAKISNHQDQRNFRDISNYLFDQKIDNKISKSNNRSRSRSRSSSSNKTKQNNSKSWHIESNNFTCNRSRSRSSSSKNTKQNSCKSWWHISGTKIKMFIQNFKAKNFIIFLFVFMLCWVILLFHFDLIKYF
jgi:hypothetical protein